MSVRSSLSSSVSITRPSSPTAGQRTQTVGTDQQTRSASEVLIENLRKGPLTSLKDDEFPILRDALPRLASDAQRQICVNHMVPLLGPYIDRLMNACCASGGNPSSIHAALDELQAWQALLRDIPSEDHLKRTIGDALGYLQTFCMAKKEPQEHTIADALPQTASPAEQAPLLLTRHGNNPLRLFDELYPLLERIQTAQDWLALHEASKHLSGSLHDRLADRLFARLKEIDRSEQIKALRKPALPSGRGLQAFGHPHVVDTLINIWPLVALQLLPASSPVKAHKADATGLSGIRTMTHINRWFHWHLRAYPPTAALRLLQHSTWFSQNIGPRQALPRWTRLPPFQDFLQWTQPAGDVDPQLSDERRLLLLLQAALREQGQTNVSLVDRLKPLWESHCSKADPATAERLQLPRLLAQAVLSTPFPTTAELSDRHKSVLDWLKPLLSGLAPSLARPAWVELGIGIQAAVIANRQAKSCFFVVNWTYRLAIFDHAVQALIKPWADAAKALEGVAAVLMGTQHNHLNHPYPAATERQVNAALSFMGQFGSAHPLQGSFRVALDILQQQALLGLLTEHQRGLLDACLRNDPTQPSSKALALT